MHVSNIVGVGSSEDYEALFARAAAIAAKVPQHLQEAAFNRALDLLTKRSGATEPATAAPPARSTAQDPDDRPADSASLHERIDRTRCPDIGATSRLADRALKVLELALHQYAVDGLTAGEIADVLTRTFRLPAKANAVNMALARETATAHLRKNGSRSVFHITQPGEEYLGSLRAGEALPGRRPSRPKVAAPKRKSKGRNAG